MTVEKIEPGRSSDAENLTHSIWFDRGEEIK
jgi:hypothetical protein